MCKTTFGYEEAKSLVRAVIEECGADDRGLVDGLRKLRYRKKNFNLFLVENPCKGEFCFDADELLCVDLPRCCNGIRVKFLVDVGGISVEKYFPTDDRLCFTPPEGSPHHDGSMPSEKEVLAELMLRMKSKDEIKGMMDE